MIKRFFSTSLRNYASYNRVNKHQKPFEYKTVDSQAIALNQKGFLRSQKAYEPPANVQETVKNIVSELGGVKDFKGKKFDLLTRCAAAFGNHRVPNSQLFEIETIENVIEFYATPVDKQTPYETLVKENSVPNLHIIPEYRRFNPDEDGVSAFPKSSTLVTGLKYRKKYKGYTAKTSWP